LRLKLGLPLISDGFSDLEEWRFHCSMCGFGRQRSLPRYSKSPGLLQGFYGR
jgi:hypothetical protein